MRKVYITATVDIILNMDEGVDLSDVMDGFDIELNPNGDRDMSDVDIDDVSVSDWNVTDSK